MITSILLGLIAAGCIVGLVWLVHRRESTPDVPRPGSDEQFGQWLGDGDREGGPANPGGGG